MSYIVGNNNTDSQSETTSADGGLQVVAKQEQNNIIEVRGDSKIGITGGLLEDRITTGAGDADIYAAAGNDEIIGGNGNDTIRGGTGDDIIKGGLGADVLLGGEGNDILRGGFSAMDENGNYVALLNEDGKIDLEDNGEPKFGDVLKGGSGADIFEFSADEFQDGVIDKIADFKEDYFADSIKIFGVGAQGNVTYDDTTGIVSVNGNEAIDIGKGQNVNFKQNEFEGETNWELF